MSAKRHSVFPKPLSNSAFAKIRAARKAYGLTQCQPRKPETNDLGD